MSDTEPQTAGGKSVVTVRYRPPATAKIPTETVPST